jgi:AcrR family transcriptional regulator
LENNITIKELIIRGITLSTKNLIIEVARKIFLENGYKKANIRDIANEAEVSTGAIYGYFINKEKLYEAAIGPLPKEYYNKYLNAISKINKVDYTSLIKKLKQSHYDGIELFLDYVYADFIAWKLIINGEGTNYHTHLEVIVNKEITAFNLFLDLLEREKIEFNRPNSHLIESVIRNLVDDMIRIIKLDMDRDEAIIYSKQVADFFLEGWMNILNLKF